MDSNLKLRNSEIEQFLCDVREHFKASLETSEYENTSNLFHVTEAEATARLLHRCELLLQQYTNTNTNIGTNEDSKKPQQEHQLNRKNSFQSLVNGTNVSPKMNGSTNVLDERTDEASYLDMTANIKKKSSTEYMDLTSSIDSDKTFRCSTRLTDVCDGKVLTDKHESNLTENGRNKNGDIDNDKDNDNDDDDSFDEETQIYDICQVSQVDIDTSQKSCLTPNEADSSANDCPYINLPAGHLSIQKSTKYGQLQRIEKRLFFDQSKKYYCGILNDWLLCYADGPTASRPSLTLYLRTPGIEIEHSGDGKRREICFQITTGDPNKKFIFQAINEVDAKEWIHAIEAAIRSDTKQPRKLPTPPLMKKITFVNNVSRVNTAASMMGNDCIYEEPSPVYDEHTPNELLIGKPPDLPDKLNSPAAMAKKYEYDIPKCPAQPIANAILDAAINHTEIETVGLLNITSDETTMGGEGNVVIQHATEVATEKVDFQTKVKDLHSKLSSQLFSAASSTYTDRMLKKTARKTYSNSSSESETLSLTSPTAKDQKKQKKSNTPIASPQKCQNNNNNNKNTNSSNSCNNNDNNTTITTTTTTTTNNNNNNSAEKSAKNWFLNRLNKTTSSVRNSSSAMTPSSMTKCRQSEKENLLNSLELTDSIDGSSNPSSPILKSGNANTTANNNNCNSSSKSKVNMIINQFEASGGHLAMFSMEAMANFSAVFSSDNNDCNNYEPVMTIPTRPSSIFKKV